MEYLRIEPKISEEFSGLNAQLIKMKDVNVKKSDPDLEDFRKEVYRRISNRWILEELSQLPIFKAYREFFWKIGIDPTKTRPASEALIRRVLYGRKIPRINTLVDAYNLASMETGIPLAAFDYEQLKGNLLMRKAGLGEKFLGIGMSEPITLDGDEFVVQDDEKLIAIYPYRDAESSKITPSTQKVILMVCGVPGISKKSISEAGEVAVEYITRFCDGVLLE